jgi:hypothetical protein
MDKYSVLMPLYSHPNGSLILPVRNMATLHFKILSLFCAEYEKQTSLILLYLWKGSQDKACQVYFRNKFNPPSRSACNTPEERVQGFRERNSCSAEPEV